MSTGTSSGKATASTGAVGGAVSASASSMTASSSSTSKAGALAQYAGANYGRAMAGAFSVVALFAGAGAFLL